MKNIVIGTLAHVDAGKTTLTESMLYLCGNIRKLGRVDHWTTFLDYDQQERERGITIFSKQSILQYKDVCMTVIDTPGHIDFSSEMERTLQILDYAIIIISGLDGVQAHTQTIWKLLEAYQIPTFIFVNKMDISHRSENELLFDIQDKLNEKCINMNDKDVLENIAMCDEFLLNNYLENQTLSLELLQKAVKQRTFFPCFFGSALKNIGIEVLLNSLNELTIQEKYPDNFGAKIYKITCKDNERLVHMKITGGVLKVKAQIGNDKIDQMRKYSGSKYTLIQEAKAGDICVVTGLNNVKVGDGLGFEKSVHNPILEPYMSYRIVLPKDCDRFKVLTQLRQLGEEDPQLHMVYDEKNQEITVELMGEIQIEVLQKIIEERYHIQVSFDHGSLVYKETIENVVEGVGHFEPLRHYAEVHLLLEPGEPGSGLIFKNCCLEDVLEKHWQRLIMTHLKEKEHIGVLIGAPITDMKISLIGGRAHKKHTEGGDFRQATYRAVRNGLAKAKSLLLEPYLHYEMIIPSSYLGRALFDIESMHGISQVIESTDFVKIVGEGPASTMQSYQNQVYSYTKGQGQFICQMAGYKPCHNQDEIIEKYNYHSELDIDNPSGSIFCQHGAGFYVPFDEVEKYMHIDTGVSTRKTKDLSETLRYSSSLNEDDELEEIFTRTYGKVKHRTSKDINHYQTYQTKVEVKKVKPQCILIDGYNVIHAWPELKEIAKDNLDGARFRLLDMMCNYQGYKNCLLIVVFDAYKVKGNPGTKEQYHNIHVVYTKEAQTADMYIERVTRKMANDYQITVATSDLLEQLIVIGAGAYRMSSRELILDYQHINQSTQDDYEIRREKSRNFGLEDIKKLNMKNK